MLLLLWTLVGMIPAQDVKPRFRLPEATYDYLTLRMPRGLSGVPLPRRSDTADRERQNATATLGRVLFYDRQLSANHSRSCASCHQQRRGFADASRRSKGFRGQRTHRNSMSIANLRFHRGNLFWDGRTRRLEDLVLMPIADEIEMGLPVRDLIQRLRADRGYDPLLLAAFGSVEVTRERIASALAAFVRAIVSLQSRFDAGYAVAGDVAVDFANFSASENRGKAMFYGVNGSVAQSCAACHVERVPSPCVNAYTVNAVMLSSSRPRNNGLDGGAGRDDQGLSVVSGRSEDRGKFRAPSLRNIEVTGPYMHDGRFQALAEVVKFYAHRVQLHANLDHVLRPDARGGGAWARAGQRSGNAVTIGSPVRTVGAPPGFPMGSREQRDLVAFLRTLTDHELLRAPRFSDPFVR